MKLPRRLHRIYAHARGYFWRPCAICRRPFGAHEAGEVLLFIAPGNSEAVCASCEPEAIRRNRARFCSSIDAHVQRIDEIRGRVAEFV